MNCLQNNYNYTNLRYCIYTNNYWVKTYFVFPEGKENWNWLIFRSIVFDDEIIDEKDKHAIAVAEGDNLSLAIGKNGQNTTKVSLQTDITNLKRILTE